MKNGITNDSQATTEDVSVLSNTDRLRLHLTEDGLALALLEAWLSEPKTAVPERMLTAIEVFHGKEKAGEQ